MSSALAEPLLAAAAAAAQSPPSPPPRPSTPRNASRGSLTRGGRTPPIFVHSQTAAAEEFNFPHDPFCAHCRSTRLSVNEARWGTRLCDGCYDAVVKDCKHCGARLSKNELLWNTAMCNACYDHKKQSVEELARRTNSAITADVGTLIGAQLIFYMAPSAMTPSLFLEIQEANFTKYWWNGDAASAYAAVLTTTTVVAMAAPIPFGIWAEARGEHEVYFGVTLVATLAALVLAWAPTFTPQWGPFGLPIFAGAWGCLSAPLSLRGVRAAYFSRHVVPTELSRIGQLASTAGLVGSVAGPLFAALCRNAFRPAALFAAVAHALAAGLLFTYLPLGGASRRAAERRASREWRDDAPPLTCERCSEPLTETEERYGYLLCDACYDRWKFFKGRALLAFCLVAALLELSLNAAVIAPFQPIAVEKFGWGSDHIAFVNLLSAALSVVVSLATAQLRLPEWGQVITAAGIYVSATLFFAWPPQNEWRIVLGLMLGLKAQILFMAPFTATFSRLIGGSRITNALTTTLCLAPLFGAALGTALAPLLIPFTGSALYVISAVPGAIGLLLLVAAWHVLENMYRDSFHERPYMSPTIKRALWAVQPSKPSVTCAHAGAHAGATCDSSSNAIPSVSSSEADPQGSYRPPQQSVP